MKMIEENKNAVSKKEEELIKIVEEDKKIIDLIELSMSDKKAFIEQICGADIKKFILDHECTSTIKKKDDIYAYMNKFDEQVKKLIVEIDREKGQKKNKINDRNTLEEKRNSFLKGKDIKKLDKEIEVLNEEIKKLSMELKKEEDNASNIRIVGQKKDESTYIAIDKNDKESFKQFCKNVFHVIEENILKKYE